MVGFEFNIVSWMAERTVQLMEEYCQNGADINSIPYNISVRGYGLGRMVTHWKCAGTPGWMQHDDFKRRLEAIGFDSSLNAKEAKFAARCRHLKAWKLQHGGINPSSWGKHDNRDDEEKSLYKFRWTVNSGHYHAESMMNPKLKALFDEAEAVGPQQC